MMKQPESKLSLIDEVIKLPTQKIGQLWGSPLLLDLDNELYFECVGDESLTLEIRDKNGKPVRSGIKLSCIAGQICGTYKEVDLVFRLVEGEPCDKSSEPDKWLDFDQDHDDSGAPGNGGSTGTGRR